MEKRNLNQNKTKISLKLFATPRRLIKFKRITSSVKTCISNINFFFFYISYRLTDHFGKIV